MTFDASDHDLDGLLALAVDLAREAGALLRSYARRADLEVRTKTSATDPVSAADHASEQLISDRLRAARPDDGLMGEERARDRAGTTGLRWVVDPLDGTVNFLLGIPQWSVSIAVEDADGALCGVVYDPNRDETFSAARARGAWLNGSPLRVTPPERISDAMVATGYSYDPEARRQQGVMIVDLLDTIRDIRRFGSAALDLSWLGAGRWHGYAEFGLHRWDYSAGSLIVREAGGLVAHWELVLGGATRQGLSAGADIVHEHLAAWLRRSGATRVEV